MVLQVALELAAALELTGGKPADQGPDKSSAPSGKHIGRPVYLQVHAAGADEKFVLHIQPKTGHKVNPESMTLAKDWFVRWLKP